jgi:hypothetical protein
MIAYVDENSRYNFIVLSLSFLQEKQERLESAALAQLPTRGASFVQVTTAKGRT